MDVAEESVEPYPTATALWPVERWQGGHLTRNTDVLAEEAPVALYYNGLPYAVMLATPSDLEDFALGFTVSEGIVAEVGEVRRVDISSNPGGIEIRIRIPPECMAGLSERERNLTGRTGCGMCGTRTLTAALRRPPPLAAVEPVRLAHILTAARQLRARQTVNQLTGATHAAAWVTADGVLAEVREDVGRHNALDKLIGGLATKPNELANGLVLITSRASYEMVLKAATVGIGVLAAVSAPTALAVRLAQELRMTLVGYVRYDNFVVYAQP